MTLAARRCGQIPYESALFYWHTAMAGKAVHEGLWEVMDSDSDGRQYRAAQTQ